MTDLVHTIESNLGHEPTPGQRRAIASLSEYVTEFKDALFLLTGYAGTGKTSLVAALVKTLKDYRLKTVLLAPTGRAAKVLTQYADEPAYTIHKKIYRQRQAREGIGEFELDRNLHRNTLFIVDEASMIADQSIELSIFGSGRLLEDLLSYTFSGVGCKLMLIGDEAQLPPVGLTLSPALDPACLERYGFPVRVTRLTDVVRQSLDSGILVNATRVRDRIREEKSGFPSLIGSAYPDVAPIRGDELLESLQSSYDRIGLDQTLVVTRSNKQANRYNQGIRNQILWKDTEIETGDLVMVVKNNYFWLKDSPEVDFIANGDILEVIRVKSHTELYNLRFVELTLRFTDYRQFEFDATVILDTLQAESASLDRETMRNFFTEVAADYQHMKGKKHRQDAIMQDPYFNALQIKFAYALTCHKAQGGQWKHVYIDQGWQDENKLDKEYHRWLYTAMTRATEKLFLVNFKETYFGDG